MDIYGLEVVEIPTNLKVSRIDDDDEIYRTQKEKLGGHRHHALRTAPAAASPSSSARRRSRSPSSCPDCSRTRTYILGLSVARSTLRPRSSRTPRKASPSPESELKAYLNDIGDYLADASPDKAEAIPWSPIRC